MYLIDTNIISELRKKERADTGVQQFFAKAIQENQRCFISVVTVGELHRGVELIRHRNDLRQAEPLEIWLNSILESYRDNILGIDQDIAQLWGRLRVPHPENALDKLIAATAIIYDLTLVTRNDKHFSSTGVNLLNPFSN